MKKLIALDKHTKFALIYTADDSNATQYLYYGDTFEDVYNFMINRFFDGVEDGIEEIEDGYFRWSDNGKTWEITFIEKI